jgi:hypothetical protein
MIINLLVLSFALYCVILYQVADFTPAPLSDAATDRPVVYADDRAEHIEGRAAIVSPRAPTGEAAQSDSGDVAAPLAAEEAAKNAAIARAEAQLDDRQHAARQRTAQLVTADLERGRREEADRIVVELEAALRAADDAAAAERARLAQLEVEKRARDAAAEKLAAEEAAKNAAIAPAEAQLDDRQHSARQRTAQLVTADLERGRREEADRIVAVLDKTLQSGDDMISVVAKQQNTNERVKSAKIAKASAEVEDLLHASRGRAAGQITTALRENSNGRAVGLSHAADDAVLHVSRVEPLSQANSITGSSKSLRSDRLDQKAAQFGINGAESQKSRSATLESGANSQKSLHGSTDEFRIESQSRALSASVSSLASLNGLEGKLRRRCSSILASSSEYDDDLVSLCQTWVAGR